MPIMMTDAEHISVTESLRVAIRKLVAAANGPFSEQSSRVIVDGISYNVLVGVSRRDYMSCSDAERELNTTLRWEEKANRWEGFHHDNGCELAVVRK